MRDFPLHRALWTMPEDQCFHRHYLRRFSWRPEVDEILTPTRMVDDIVWFQALDIGKEGVAMIASTYNEKGRVNELLDAVSMKTIAVNLYVSRFTIVWVRPLWVDWTPDAPDPVWVLKWLSDE